MLSAHTFQALVGSLNTRDDYLQPQAYKVERERGPEQMVRSTVRPMAQKIVEHSQRRHKDGKAHSAVLFS
jgi:hypothetical protein